MRLALNARRGFRTHDGTDFAQDIFVDGKATLTHQYPECMSYNYYKQSNRPRSAHMLHKIHQYRNPTLKVKVTDLGADYEMACAMSMTLAAIPDCYKVCSKSAVKQVLIIGIYQKVEGL